MPYESQKQERWAHTESAKKAGFPTAEFDKASKGMKLPLKVNPKEHMKRIAESRMPK
jgi:hypothetical protein